MTDYRALARRIAAEFAIPENLFLSLIGGESNWDPYAVGKLGELGLGQLMPATAAGLGVDPLDPAQNLRGAATYLRQFYDRYGAWRPALADYKGGPGGSARQGPLTAADAVLSAAGMTAEAASQAAEEDTGNFDWKSPTTWIPFFLARGLDSLVMVAGIAMIALGAWVLAVRVSPAGVALAAGASRSWLDGLEAAPAPAPAALPAPEAPAGRDEVIAALVALGYSKKEAAGAAAKVPAGVAVEEGVKLALKSLVRA